MGKAGGRDEEKWLRLQAQTSATLGPVLWFVLYSFKALSESCTRIGLGKNIGHKQQRSGKLLFCGM
jgi:hypothetical protein